MNVGSDGADSRRQRVLDLAIWIGLAVSVLGVYGQVTTFEFVNFDDNVYVYQEPHVKAGLTVESIRWALTSPVSNNWSPVTVLSHIVDAELFDMRSGAHHFVNVVFHILAAGFLCLALRRATGASGPSAFVAFVFALHPLNTGTVAWVSERKDVLCAFFWFLALYGYLRYREHPSLWRYWLWVGVPFLLGLLSKPMMVTFPVILLLFDVWPLRRTDWPKPIWEKLPFLALSIAVAMATYGVQSSTGAVQTIPYSERIAHGVFSYSIYIRQLLWPTGLAVLYPYTHGIATWKVAAVTGWLLAVSALAVWVRRDHPYFTVGWFWYLVALIPVIGLVQVGRQSHADRYGYIPTVGLTVMVAWGALKVVEKRPRWQPVITIAAVATCCVLAVVTWNEASFWRNSGTLYQRVIDVTGDNAVAENNLGAYQAGQGFYADAIRHYQTALRLQPDYAAAENNLGRSLSELDGCEAAIPHFEAAIREQPGYAIPIFHLGECATRSGNYEAAIPYFERAIRAEPGYVDARFGLAVSLSKIPGRAVEAVQQYESAVAQAPEDGALQAAYGEFLAGLGRKKEAIAHLEAAESIRPDDTTERLLDRLRRGPD